MIKVGSALGTAYNLVGVATRVTYVIMERVVKPKNQRTKRVLENRAPKLIENTKRGMFIKGGNTSELITKVMTDLYLLKKPDAVFYRRKNMLKPFEDPTTLEFFSRKSDSSLFIFGSHNKKRPHNIIIGRLFDYRILDMIELGVEQYKSLHSFTSSKCSVGSKPCLIFSGDLFETDHEYIRLKSIFIDFFRGTVSTQLNLAGFEHVITFTAVEGKLYLRVYRIILKKSGSRIPRIELEEMGPSINLTLRRTHLSSRQLLKLASKQPKQTKPKKEKNKSMDPFGSSLGRIHMSRQNYSDLHTRKVKGLKRSKDPQEKHAKKLKLDC